MFLPDGDCPLCPRLRAFRQENRARFPEWHNAPVPPFGSALAPLLIVGLAPGLRGANRTGRPFTGDFAGELLFATLRKYRLAEGEDARASDDGLHLTGCRITNAVRCVPPLNWPTPTGDTHLWCVPARRDRRPSAARGGSRARPTGARRRSRRARPAARPVSVHARNSASARWRTVARRQLSLFPTEHQHRTADGRDVETVFARLLDALPSP